MNKQCLYFLVIFSFLLPISPRCSFDHAPMNGICTPCDESGCAACYGDPNYCTNCNQTSLIRGKCHPCDDVNCEFCYLTHSGSTKCSSCKDGFYPKPSVEGDCIECPENCPYCGQTWNVDVCHKCDPPHQAYNGSVCTPCPKNCHLCGKAVSNNEFQCTSCENGYTLTPTGQCTACLVDNCFSCEFESLDKCSFCLGDNHLHDDKCLPNIPNCGYQIHNTCQSCYYYFYLTTENTCKPIPEKGCKYWDNINLQCIEGCQPGWWDFKQGVCSDCWENYIPLTTFANISYHKYKNCNQICDTVVIIIDDNSYPPPNYCLIENKCPPGYYLNKYRNCIGCEAGWKYCSNCTNEGCVTAATGKLWESNWHLLRGEIIV